MFFMDVDYESEIRFPRPASEIRFFPLFFPDFLYKTKMGDQWGTRDFLGREGLDGANKSKIGPKTSKSAKNSKKWISFSTRKCLNSLGKTNFFTRKGLNRLG